MSNHESPFEPSDGETIHNNLVDASPTKHQFRSIPGVSRSIPLYPTSQQADDQTGETTVSNPSEATVAPESPELGKKPHTPRRPINIRLLVPLVLLAVLIIGGSLLGSQFIYGRTASNTPALPSNHTATNVGNFVTPPLTSQQVDNLRHLSAHMKYRQLAYLTVSKMSLEQEIGQIMMVEFQENGYSPALDTMIHNLHVGGVIMYQRQINTVAQTKRDVQHMQQRADFPLLISADEEGWNVHRLTNIYPPRLSAYDIHASKNVSVATSEGKKVAHDLLSVGINTNFAPDVDVSTDDGYIGYDQRSFGPTPEDVITYAGAYTKAMQENGVIASMKHFPGLGSAPKSTDPHAVFVTIKQSKEQLYHTDLVPFQHFITARDKMQQPGLIMSTDELVPSIDPTYIAELSPTFMTKILRQEMGYDGVAVTDALSMLGVQVNGRHLSLPEAGLMALKAGNDLLLGAGSPASLQAMVNAIKTAVKNGTLSKSRLDEAATRVLALKMERNLIPTVPPEAA
ncbi:hypothetical protein KDA_16910 [Dictyobacter alpinus]|uniref:Glycoside hydrolase family 3 N-terminal domain-containing protein n=1 Tax=Dictyobacter alpinus TaxID=2014873 RepID=A0A402B4G7_9CHLR|nr:glycoside hydrolase family 3 N-terminal domain-containing protein [Dictyobacter alpinus]GCE26207.1 hypothetical protein KDA_16910 [Dictyobacter alpinus]